eukprot:gene5737-7921_t
MVLDWSIRNILVFTAVIPKLTPLLQKLFDPWENKPLTWIQKIMFGGINSYARLNNGYEVHGLQQLQEYNESGGCLLIGYHSRCSLDLLYFWCAVQPSIIVSYLLFYIPFIGLILPLFGAIRSAGGVHGDAEEVFIRSLSENKKPLVLLPGGAWEFTKPFNEHHQILWKTCPGFARVIVSNPDKLGSHVKVIPFYTKNCEKSLWSTVWWNDASGNFIRKNIQSFKNGDYYVIPSLLTCLFFSLGFVFLPAPVKMDTYFAEPVILKDGENAETFAARVRDNLQELINEVDTKPEREFPEKISFPFYLFLSIVTIVQGIVIHTPSLILIWTMSPLVAGVLYANRFLFKKKKRE